MGIQQINFASFIAATGGGGSGAIAFDAFSTSGYTPPPGVTAEWSHTTGSGSDRLLLVAVFVRGDTDVVTGVTYDGNAMTHVVTEPYGSGALYL